MSSPGSDDLEPISSPAADPTATGLAPPSNKVACAALGCNSTRLRKDCCCWRCKTHCMELGVGCTSATHKPSTTLPPTQLMPLLTFQLQTVSDPGPSLHSTLSHPLHPTRDTHFPSSAPLATGSSSVHPTLSYPLHPTCDTHFPLSVPPATGSSSMPIHRSHMAPVLIEQRAVEQRLRAEKRSQDELLLSQTQKVQ